MIGAGGLGGVVIELMFGWRGVAGVWLLWIACAASLRVVERRERERAARSAELHARLRHWIGPRCREGGNCELQAAAWPAASVTCRKCRSSFRAPGAGGPR